MAKSDCLFFKGSTIFMRRFSNSRSLVITNMRIQGRDKHQGFVKKFVNAFTINFNTIDAFIGEGYASVAEEANGPQNVGDHQGLEDKKNQVRRKKGKFIFYVPFSDAKRESLFFQSRLPTLTLKTFNSKSPLQPPTVTATWLPMTWAVTILIDSHWVGLTLPKFTNRDN